MSEYIIAHCVDEVSGVQYDEHREEIVRCRDCKWFKHNSFPRCDLRMQAVEVELDGFCAWGERRGE